MEGREWHPAYSAPQPSLFTALSAAAHSGARWVDDGAGLCEGREMEGRFHLNQMKAAPGGTCFQSDPILGQL